MVDTVVGKLITDSNAERDAIHVAVLPAIAGEKLSPGDKIKVDSVSYEAFEVSSGYVGIVDPFLSKVVKKGERFYCFLLPNTVTGMRHHWQHPQFAENSLANNPQFKKDAESWLKSFAHRYGIDYSYMMITAEQGNDYITAHGTDVHGSYDLEPGEYADFWNNVSIVTGKHYSDSHKESVGWSCSC